MSLHCTNLLSSQRFSEIFCVSSQVFSQDGKKQPNDKVFGQDIPATSRTTRRDIPDPGPGMSRTIFSSARRLFLLF